MLEPLQKPARRCAVPTALLVAVALSLATVPSRSLSAEPGPKEIAAGVSIATTNTNGILVHTVRCDYQAGKTRIEVLLPDGLKKGKRYRVLYVLPVETQDSPNYGDALVEVKRHDLHNKHQLICVQPTFHCRSPQHLSWYADHPTDAGMRHESYFLKVVVPLVEGAYPALAEQDGRLLLGFSKSGWGAFSLLLRHPDVFGKAAAWDAPLEEAHYANPRYSSMGLNFGNQENFEKYRIARLLEQRAAMLKKEPCRLILSGYGTFRSQQVAAHDRMVALKIPHVYRDGPQRKHDWRGGWVAETVALLVQSPLTAPSGGAKGPAADRRADADYLEHRIKHISDAELFAALDLDRPGLEAVKAAVEAEDCPAAYRAWAAYWDAKQKVTWIEHGRELKPIAEVAASLRSDPALVARARRGAEPLMRHQIHGWGGVTHQHGRIVDFDFNYGRSGKYGFHYWGWSGPLLTAYHATGEAKYLAEFDRLFNAWYEQRDAVQGAIRSLDVIWYELGLGLRNRKFLHYYTCPLADRSTTTHERMLKTALGAARWLHELQRRGYRGGNWQIMGSYGLVDIAVRLPEFREAPSWLKVGVERLADHIQRDFFEDGCHSERVPSSYMVIAYRDPRNLMALLRAAGVESESVEQFDARLEKILEWWMLATNPLGGLPGLNDGQGCGLPAADLREGAKRYGRPDFLYVADRLASGAAKSDGKPPRVTSVHLKPSGVTVMRGGWRRDDNYLFINHGTHAAGHTHRAALDFELIGRGAPLALDAGIGRSYDDPLHGRWYTAARAHNMLVVDGAGVDRKAARGRDVFWHSDELLDVFAATHEGYLKSHGLTHRRAVAFLKPDVFVVFDSCTAKQQGQTLSWYFHSPTELTVGQKGRVISAAGPGVLLMEAWPDRLAAVRQGQGMCSMSIFGAARQIDWVAYDKVAKPGADNRFAVLMLPFSDTPPEVRFTALPSPPGTAAVRLSRGATTDFLVFGNGRRLTLLEGRLVTDAVLGWVREDGNGQRRATIVGGKTLTWDGQALPRSGEQKK